ncbi:MAG: iron ABC transporter permease [Hyphomicrobiales bacterium]|nr:MAG: iron ABC transporter permease [Hyphomicrobiales bacterium]
MNDIAIAARVQRRHGPALGVIVLALLLGASVILAVGFGHADISPAEVWHSICHHLACGVAAPDSLIRDGIIWDLRLPRVLTAAAVGAGLAVCGAVMQALTRNPLADPFLLGLSSGASLGAVAVIMAGASILLPLAAFIGAMAALLGTLALAGSLGTLTPARMVLSGVAISSLAAALTSLLIFWSATGDSYREIIGWLMGSLGGVHWQQAGIAAATVLAVLVPVLLAARALDAMTLGDAAAATLGINVTAIRWGLLAATALLTGILVSIGGSIGFVGLVLPHAVRMVVRAGHRVTIPLAALCGAIFMVWADTIARTAFDPRELPVGIVTAMVGAPVFILILLRTRRSYA